MIPRAIIDRVRAVNLHVVAADYVALKKSGAQYLTQCLWHSDTDPSLRIYADHYYCFACQASGSSIDFVMQAQGISFSESVTFLAERFGISMEGREVSRIQQQYAEEESRFCAFWWSMRRNVLRDIGVSSWECELDDLAESVRLQQEQISKLSTKEKFAIFREKATEMQRRLWKAEQSDEKLWMENLQDLWVRYAKAG